MNLQILAIVAVVSALISGTAVYHFFPQTKTVEVTKEVVKTDIQTVVHTVTQPNGVVDTTTTTTDHSQRTETSKNTQIILAKPKINISGLVANDFNDRLFKPVYGVSVSKEFLGPITIGMFGLSNSTIGVSLGVSF